MAEWTPEATEYLEGYLKQVGALARGAGEDGDEIASGLREHIIEKTEHEAGALVTLEVLRRALAEVGAPEEVVDNPGAWKTVEPPRPAADVHLETPPPVASNAPDRSGRFLRWMLGCLVLLIIGLVLLPVLGIVLGITLPALSRSREAARRAVCQNHLKQIAVAIEQWENDHPDAGAYPQKMSDLYPNYIKDIEIFACPGQRNTDRSVNEVDTWSAYAFNNEWNGDAKQPVIQELSTTNHSPAGRHVMFNDGRVEFQKAEMREAPAVEATQSNSAVVDQTDPVGVARAFVKAVSENNMDKALQLTAEDQRSSLREEWDTIRTIPNDPNLEVTRLADNRDADISVAGTGIVLHVVVRNGKWWMAR